MGVRIRPGRPPEHDRAPVAQGQEVDRDHPHRADARPPDFFASGLITSGCDVVTVQKALGHASPSVTLNTYSHMWPDAGDRIRTAAAGLWIQTRDYVGTTDPSKAPAEHKEQA
jgi:integrase